MKKGRGLIKILVCLLVLLYLGDMILFLVPFFQGKKNSTDKKGQILGDSIANSPVENPEFVSNEILVKLTEEGAAAGIKSLDKLNNKFKATETKKVFNQELKKKKGKKAQKVQISQELDRWVLIKFGGQKKVSKKTLEESTVSVDGAEISYQSVLETYNRNDMVEFAQPNYIYQPFIYTPNDTYYSSTDLFSDHRPDLWNINTAGSPGSAWDVTTGNNVIVAVVDSGVDYNHPDLAANILRDEGGDIVGYDFVNDDSDPMDDVGHGTHVAGTIAAVGNNDPNHAVDSGTKTVGVGFGLKIMPVKGMGTSGGTDIDLAESLNFAAEHGAKVINNSWGGMGQSQLLTEVIQDLHDQNIITVFAAGNDQLNIDYINPAGDPNAITVGSFNYSNASSCFSNLGARLDLVAPGGDLVSCGGSADDSIVSTITNPFDPTLGTPVGDYYAKMSGTSVSAAHVSAAAGLVLAVHPDWTFEEVRFALRNTATLADIAPRRWSTTIGSGRLRLNNAVRLAQAPPTPFLNIAEATIAAPGHSVNGDVSARNGVSGWVLSYGEGSGAAEWHEIQSGSSAISGELGQLPVIDYNGTITLKLSVTDQNAVTSNTYADFYYSPDLLAGWPQELGASFEHPALGDVNFDGQNEIVVAASGTPESKLWVKTADSNSIANFPLTYDAGNLSPPTLADMNNDGKLEIIFTHYQSSLVRNTLHVVKSDGQELAGWPVILPLNPADDIVYADPTVVDVTGDDQPEILLESYASTVYVYEADGQPLAGWPVYLDSEHYSPNYYYKETIIQAEDLTGDGKAEIFAGRVDSQGHTSIYALDYEGNVLTGWPQVFNYATLMVSPRAPNIGLADINNDGEIEIVGYVNGYSGEATEDSNLTVWTLDGQTLWTQTYAGGGRSGEGGPLFSNIDGNPGLEIITNGTSGLYVFDGEGNILDGWPKESGFDSGIDMALADVNTDDLPEFIGFNSSGDVKTSIVNLAGAGIWVKRPYMQIEQPAVVGDIDGDGVLELVNNARYYFSHYTYVWKITGATSADNALAWPQFGGNAQHERIYPVSLPEPTDSTPPTVSITSPANGATVSGTINFQVTAQDNVGVTKVELFHGQTLLTTLNAAPYLYQWNTTTIANGNSVLTAKAYDAAENSAISTAVNITINNSSSTIENSTAPPSPTEETETENIASPVETFIHNIVNKLTAKEQEPAKPSPPIITNMTAQGTNLFIEGTAGSNVTVYLTFRSNFFKAQTKANNQGYWSYLLANASIVLGEGDHTVVAVSSVTAADNTAIESEQSKTYDFKLSIENGQLQVEMKKTRVWQYVAGGSFVLVLILGYLLWRRRKRA